MSCVRWTRDSRMRAMNSLRTIVDLDRYPIDRLDRPEGRGSDRSCREMLTHNGACQLHGFVRSEAVDAARRRGRRLRSSSHRTDDTHNVYFEPIDETLSANDVPRRLQRSAKFTVGYDRIPSRLAPAFPLRDR